MLAIEPTSTSDPDRLAQDLGGAAGKGRGGGRTATDD